jgi:hypothetical protein
MPTEEILLGKLALAHGLVSRAQLDACVQEQEASGRPLGEILVARGIISQVDLATLLAEQDRNLQKRHETTFQRKQDSLFGRVAVMMGLVPAAEVNACVREQARIETMGMKIRLGKVMVQRGLLTVAQVMVILDYQRKQILYCEACDAMFNAPRAVADKVFHCRTCKAPLVAAHAVTHCEVEELFQGTDETQIAPGTAPAHGAPSSKPDETTDVNKKAAPATKSTLPPPGDEATVEHDDWFVANEGRPAGPFEYGNLRRMAEMGQLAPKTYVWRPGMDAWLPAGDVPEVAAVFTTPASETAIVSAPPEAMPEGVHPPKIEGFTITGFLGKGGLGNVFHGRQVAMERDVAIRALLPELEDDTEFVDRLVKDSRASARAGHSSLVQFIDIRQADGHWYFISELVEGPRVSDLLAGGASMAEARALEVGREAAAALEAAHRAGVLHRDVKPENIKLTGDGHAKVCDLGLTRRKGSPPEGIRGTEPYAAPETASGRLEARSEIYALGATLYHMVTGLPPPQPGVDPRYVNPAVSERTSLLIARMIAREPEARPASMAECAREMESSAAKLAAPKPAAPAGWGQPGAGAAMPPAANRPSQPPGVKKPPLRRHFRRR